MRNPAALWVLAPLLWNPWSADWLLGSAELGHPALALAVTGVGLSLAGWGLRSWRRGPRPGDTRLQALVLGAFVLLPVLGELALRAALAGLAPSLRQPALFADPFGEDDYWKLGYRWTPARGPRDPSRLDAGLGWVNQKTARNPLGLAALPGYPIELDDPVLMYGDSFMAGRVPFALKIPQLSDRMLPERTVYNLGQGGYGVGQI